ncbi:NAD(P)-binding protein [Gymnopus androsaceus JB14]|uniref:NAD(P)-binding protein n=1 Tax=Gymnopus androsaceus JB14 TaxID=1447944 RepID=A0A6A4HBT5_9AGAR|nr:NAD(P)-binding protein [Gymnopus androsaceus JB14]
MPLPRGQAMLVQQHFRSVQDCGLLNALGSKVIFVTGTSSGIGAETPNVYMQLRNIEKGESVRKDILATSPGKGRLEIIEMELADLESVRTGVKVLLEKTGTVNVLVNNAGIRNPPESITKDGFELTFCTNHLAHFLIFELLLPTLLKSASESLQSSYPFASRVVNVSSGSHRDTPMNLENLNLHGIYEPVRPNILMANEIERRFGSKGVHGLSLNPGAIRTEAQRYDDPVRLAAILAQFGNMLKSVEQGAATTVWAAIAPVWEGKGGVYLSDCKEQELVEGDDRWKEGYAKHAFDENVANKLWEISSEMLGLGQE